MQDIIHVFVTSNFKMDRLNSNVQSGENRTHLSFKTCSVTIKYQKDLPHYKSMWVFCRRSMAANSVVGGSIWSKFELIQCIMHGLVTCKFKKDQININRENAETSIF